jgi:hypothetical protein
MIPRISKENSDQSSRFKLAKERKWAEPDIGHISARGIREKVIRMAVWYRQLFTPG